MSTTESNPLLEAVEKAIEKQDRSGEEWIASVLASSPGEPDPDSGNGSEPLMDSAEKALKRQGCLDLNEMGAQKTAGSSQGGDSLLESVAGRLDRQNSIGLGLSLSGPTREGVSE